MQDSSLLLPLSDSDSGEGSLTSPARSLRNDGEPRLAPCSRSRGVSRLPPSPGDRGSRSRLIEACARVKGDVVERRLSRGVFLAYSPSLGVQTVLRVDTPKNIARQAAVLRHLALHSWPGAPRYYGAWQANGMACLRIEYIAGATALEMLLTRSLTLDFLVDFQRRLARLLRSLHALDVVHLDVKPEHIVVRVDGTLCLIDWDHAQFIAAPSDQSPLALCGTFAYVAPEVLAKSAAHAHPALDVWSYGACLVVLLTGEVVRPARDPLPAWLRLYVPPDFAAVVRCALTVDPLQRPSFAQLCDNYFSLRAVKWSDALLARLLNNADNDEQPLAPPIDRPPAASTSRIRAQRSPLLTPVARSTTMPAGLSAPAPLSREAARRELSADCTPVNFSAFD